MVCRRFPLLSFIAVLTVLSSSCSDDSAAPVFAIPTAESSDSAGTSTSSSSSGEAPHSFPFVGGPVMFTEVTPVNISYKDH